MKALSPGTQNPPPPVSLWKEDEEVLDMETGAKNGLLMEAPHLVDAQQLVD